MTDLKPCPFCGGAAKYELAYGIRCLSCASHVPCGGDDYGPWNRRADLPPKVRALEWVRDSLPNSAPQRYRAETPGGLGDYSVSGSERQNQWQWFRNGYFVDGHQHHKAVSLEAAKAAAQADYEARILAALVQP